MDKQRLKLLVEMLNEQWKLKDTVGEFYFLKYMEVACDRSNEETYILKDLNLLAEVLKEMNMTYIIETIEIYDMHSAQVLDYLVEVTSNEGN